MKPKRIKRYNTHQALKLKTYRRDKFVCQLKIHPKCHGDMAEDYKKWKSGGMTRRRLALTVDHIVPVSKGGKWESSNLQTACSPCNTLKADRNSV